MWTYVLYFLGYIPKSGTAGSNENSMLNFLRIAILFSKVATKAVYEVPISPTFSPTLVIICLFDYSHSSGCGVVSNCGLHLHFPNKRCWASFHVLIGHLYIFFEEMCIWILCPFFVSGFFLTQNTWCLFQPHFSNFPTPTGCPTI